MKALAALAAVILVAQATSRSPSTPRAPLGAEPIEVLNAERAWTAADGLWPLINGQSVEPVVRRSAVRALGRAEDPQQVRALLALKGVPSSAVAGAIAQSLYGFDPARDPELLSLVEQWMRGAANQGSTLEETMSSLAGVAAPMSHIRYANPAQVESVESMLDKLADFSASSPDPRYALMYGEAIRGLEALARVNTRLVSYDEKTVEHLTKCVRKLPLNAGAEARLYAFMALTAARALEADTEREALSDDDWQVRRVAMAVLAGAGGGLDADERVAAIRSGLSDKDGHVRYEAVRGWGRHAAAKNGCQPLLDALKDDDQNVALEATDLLGTLCLDNEDVTTRLEAEATVPPTVGAWQPQTHAFVALAKRSTEKSAIQMSAFTTHQVWWVRMYSAFAAGGAKDVFRLDKLAYDDNDNVREAALNHLRAADADRAERAIVAALDRSDVQLLRTAAGIMKEWPAGGRYVKPLVAALERLTKTRSMTTRDGRTALLAAIERHGRSDDHTLLIPWLRDFDPVIAARAAEVILHLSGKTMKAEPVVAAHVPEQPFNDLRQCVTIDMSPGRPITLKMRPDLAPIAVEQFLKLAITDRYYNGLTFHRVVPNFVIQGGSPGANEYSGHRDYMRDEIGGRNVRGTVGLSTRGRNTGDAQFFVNLVDNPRLDNNYTVFATVENMEAVDRVQEGDVMRSMTMKSCR